MKDMDLDIRLFPAAGVCGACCLAAAYIRFAIIAVAVIAAVWFVIWIIGAIVEGLSNSSSQSTKQVRQAPKPLAVTSSATSSQPSTSGNGWLEFLVIVVLIGVAVVFTSSPSPNHAQSLQAVAPGVSRPVATPASYIVPLPPKRPSRL